MEVYGAASQLFPPSGDQLIQRLLQVFSKVDLKYEFCVKIPSHLTSEAGVIVRPLSCTWRISYHVISEEHINEFVLWFIYFPEKVSKSNNHKDSSMVGINR